jgi:hypothetical protein
MKLIKVAKWTAISSFLIGTGFMLIFFLSNSVEIFGAGFYFVTIAVFTNLTVLVLLAIRLVTDGDKRKQYLKSIGILFINIPIAILYAYLVIILIYTLRINFVNDSTNLISGALIEGCQSKNLGNIKPGDSKRCWIRITEYCTVTIRYQISDSTRNETIVSSPYEGGISTYRFEKDRGREISLY